MSRSPFPPDFPGEYPKIAGPLPGPNAREFISRDKRTVSQNLTKDVPLVVSRAQGMVVEDVDGNRFLDFAAGISTVSTGHCHPEVVKAIQEQAGKLLHICYTDFYYPVYVELCETLARLAPIRGDKRVFLTNSGAEAVETAVKIARTATGRTAVVACDHAFHGRTLLAMSLTAKVMPYKHGMGPFAPEIYRLPFAYPYRWPGGPERATEEALAYAIDEMHKHIGEDSIAGVIVEPIQGEGGFIVPSPGFLKGLADFCAEHGIVFIADEIQSGMGRAGRWYAIEDEGVVPDIVTTAKSLGGGLPISAVTGRADLMDAPHVGALGGTYGGNPVAAVAALAVLELIEREGLLERSIALGERMRETLTRMQERHDAIGDVRGRGMMNAVELVADRTTKEPLESATGSAIVRRCLENGVVFLKAGTYDNVIRLLPPLTIEEGLLDEGLEVLDEAIGALT